MWKEVVVCKRCLDVRRKEVWEESPDWSERSGGVTFGVVMHLALIS